MTDHPLCHYCHQPIDTGHDDYVPVELESDRYDTPQFVAHRACRVRYLRDEADRVEHGTRSDA